MIKMMNKIIIIIIQIINNILIEYKINLVLKISLKCYKRKKFKEMINKTYKNNNNNNNILKFKI